MNPEKILNYWFGTLTSPEDFPSEKSTLWFKKSNKTDQYIRDTFEPTVQEILKGANKAWLKEPKSRLAYIICIDQFCRNMYRGTPQSFAKDTWSLQACLDGIEIGHDLKLFPIERVFFYIPLEHSEDLSMQELSVKKYSELADSCPDSLKSSMKNFLHYADRHHAIIKEFGRFPHRNKILNRPSTPEELEFLKKPGSSF